MKRKNSVWKMWAAVIVVFVVLVLAVIKMHDSPVLNITKKEVRN